MHSCLWFWIDLHTNPGESAESASSCQTSPVCVLVFVAHANPAAAVGTHECLCSLLSRSLLSPFFPLLCLFKYSRQCYWPVWERRAHGAALPLQRQTASAASQRRRNRTGPVHRPHHIHAVTRAESEPQKNQRSELPVGHLIQHLPSSFYHAVLKLWASEGQSAAKCC